MRWQHKLRCAGVRLQERVKNIQNRENIEVLYGVRNQ